MHIIYYKYTYCIMYRICISGTCRDMMKQNFTDNTMLKFTERIHKKVLKKLQHLGYMTQKTKVFGSDNTENSL